jgi:hypothetical protein
MSASATSFDILFLQLIWRSALALMLLAMLVLAGLVMKRKLEEWYEVHRSARREELSAFIHAALRSPMDVTIKNLPDLYPGDEAIILRIALDMLRIMRGGDRARIVHILQNWDIFPYLRGLAEKGSRGKRIQALTLLGHFNDMKSLVVLMDKTTAKDIYVQLAALRGLAERGATKYIDQIIENLQTARKTNALMLADILGRFGEPALPSLIRLIQSDASSDVRVASIMALDRIGSLAAVKHLLPILDDPAAEIRAQAASTLGKLGDSRAGAALIHCLDDDGRNVRLHAAQALGQLSYQPALPSLVQAMEDKEWPIRFRAAQALYKLGNNGIAMLKALCRIDNESGILARQVLGEMNGRDAGYYRAA